MNRFLIPLLILLGSLLFSWFWNSSRRSNCEGQSQFSSTANCCDASMAPVAVAAPAVVDTTKKILTPDEQVLFIPLDVYFNSGKTSILRNAKIDTFLTTAKKYLAKYPNEKLSVVGHTDSDGTDESNVVLSQKRAEIVKGFLVKDGFNAANLVTEGKGETSPLVDNSTPENKAKNRRVSISLIK